MRIMYLKEKKSHESRKENSYGWNYWELKYSIDFTKRKGRRKTKWNGVKVVIYKAYIQGEKENYYDDFPSKLVLSIYKTIIRKPPSEERVEILNRKIADLDYKW